MMRNATALHSTACYGLHYIAFGLAIGMLGPAIPLFMELSAKEEGQVGLMVTGRAVGSLLGSVTAPLLVSRSNNVSSSFSHHNILFFSQFLFVCAMWAIGLCTSLSISSLLPYVFLLFFSGCASVSNSSMLNSYLGWLWQGRDLSFYMQSVHFCFGIGAVFGPLMVSWGVYMGDDASSRLSYSYLLLCVTQIILVPWVLLVPSPSSRPSTLQANPVELASLLKSESESESETELGEVAADIELDESEIDLGGGDGELQVKSREGNADSGKDLEQTFGDKAFVLAMGAFLCAYVGLEIGYASWVTAYAMAIGVDMSLSILLASIFWISLSAGRGLAVPLALVLSPLRLLIINISLCMVTLMCMMLIPPSSTLAILVAVGLGTLRDHHE